MKTLYSLLLLSVFMSIGKSGIAQTGTEELKAAQDKWWIDYAASLKKVITEKNDHQAAILLQNTRTELMPRFSKLVKDTQLWKKSHSSAEVQKMEAWNKANTHNQQVQSLQIDPGILGRLGKSKEFQQAYADLMKAMMQAGK